jgi:hypothetical protein
MQWVKPSMNQEGTYSIRFAVGVSKKCGSGELLSEIHGELPGIYRINGTHLLKF